MKGLAVPIDAGLRIEARYFTKLLMDPASRNMIRSLFLSMQDLGKGARRPANVAPTSVKKLGVLGAGMMGAGIAYVSAQAGMEVVLHRPTHEEAEKGKAYSTKLLDGQIAKGRSTEEKKQKLLSLIKPTTNYDDLKGCDLVIEAVFESREIKADVTKKAEAQLTAKARVRLEHVDACRSRVWRKRACGRRISSASTSSRRSTRCSWSRSSWARRRATTRSPWRSTT